VSKYRWEKINKQKNPHSYLLGDTLIPLSESPVYVHGQRWQQNRKRSNQGPFVSMTMQIYKGIK